MDVQEAAKVVECDYCGTQQTVPKVIDENLQNIFNRANSLRMRSEFDKAEQIYEKIIAMDSTQAEAYWGLILCRYGIEYVDDPKTLKKIPTCHRASYNSVAADEDFKSALEYADISQKVIYEREAEEIDRIQKEILSIAQNEEDYDIFICYKESDENGKRTYDSVLAQELYYCLKNEGFKVFFARITLEDKLGSAYEPYIFSALNTSNVMVVLGTKPEHFSAVWVKNEWSRYLALVKKGQNKMLIPAYKDMDPYDLPEEFSHLQAQDMTKLGFMQDLVRGIKKLLNKDSGKQKASGKSTSNESRNTENNQLLLKDGALYEGEVFANVPHGKGRAEYKNGDVYVGEWNRGLREGWGKQTGRDGSTWEGEFRGDKAWNVSGTYCYDDFKYTGQFIEGKRHGNGKITWNKGGVWEGEFQNDKIYNGYGVILNDDFAYEGAIVNGKKHGQCKITWNDGGVWEGEFSNGMPWEGCGRTCYDDAVYEGNISKGKRHGQGRLTWKNGGAWEGEFLNGVAWNGSGTLYFGEDRYDGPIVQGKKHGKGKYTWNKGGIWEGEYKEGQRWNGKGTVYCVDALYHGHIVEGEKHGIGKYIWNKGGTWEGEFKNGKPWDGRGTLYFMDGKYIGAIMDGEKHGKGEIVLYNGTSCHCDYVCGREVQKVKNGCYVATCVYGSYDCPEVWTLRRYRDNTLGSTWHGRAFIRAYYAISPTLVKWFGKTKWFKKMWRGKLDRMVKKLQSRGVESTPYQDKTW